jgi:competence protein ComFC
MKKEKFYSFIRDFIHLIFPEKCLHCSCELIENENHICDFCFRDIPYTFFENFQETNDMDKLFWGRIPVDSSYALMYFKEGTVSQTILHALKYQNNHKIGIFFGEQIGNRMNNNAIFSTIDALVPVPIHPKKKFSRGYNQAEILCEGMANQLKIPVLTHFTAKNKHTESQTRKTLAERWMNSNDVFQSEKNFTAFKHIAIVDDVLTTGSTLEHLTKAILEKNTGIKISLITLALTK